MNIEFRITHVNIIPYIRQFNCQTPVSTMTQAIWYLYSEKWG